MFYNKINCTNHLNIKKCILSCSQTCLKTTNKNWNSLYLGMIFFFNDWLQVINFILKIPFQAFAGHFAVCYIVITYRQKMLHRADIIRLFIGLLWVASLCQGQRTPTISYITPEISTKIGGTIEMDCSVLYATEYPILWVKLPSGCSAARETYNLRAQEADTCTPVPLSSGSALIVRDNRFRYYKWHKPINTAWSQCTDCVHCIVWLRLFSRISFSSEFSVLIHTYVSI